MRGRRNLKELPMTIERVFMATIAYDHFQVGMVHAFEGIFGKQNVRHFDYLELARRTNWGIEHVNDEFVKAAVDWKPDWCWLQLQDSNVISPDSLERLREKLPSSVLSHWTGDPREKLSSYFKSICRSTHITFSAMLGFLDKYREGGAPEAMYVAHGLDWDEDVMGNPRWDPPMRVPEVVYCGNHYGDRMVGSEEREACVRALFDAKIDIGVFGGGWEKTGLPMAGQCKVKQQMHVYQKAKVVLTVNHHPGLAGYHGDRTIIGMASGTPVVTPYFPRMEDEFTEGTDLLAFRSKAELVEKVKMLLGDEEMRKTIGAQGRRRAMLSHTWFSRIFQVLPRIEEIQKSLRK
jgi:hypothetical protein